MAPPSAALKAPSRFSLPALAGRGGSSTSREFRSSLPLIFTLHPRPHSSGLGPTQGTNSGPSSETQAQCQELQTERHESGWSPCHLCVNSNPISVGTALREEGLGFFHWVLPTPSHWLGTHRKLHHCMGILLGSC